MTKLLGTKPNQAPTNADLGDLAYQDGANAVIGPIAVSGGDVAIDTNTLFVDAANNRVGVGTTSPATPLEVVGSIRSSGNSPIISILDTGGGTDEKNWHIVGDNGPLGISAINDAGGGGGGYLLFTRSGNNVQTLQGYRTGVLRYELSNWDNHLLFAAADSTIGTSSAHALVLDTNNLERLRITSGGNVGIATNSPSQKLDVNDDSIRVRTAKTPASASDTGTQGQIAWDADYIYVCTATDTWKRVAIATW
jgi:hypothetical protein